MRGQESEGWSRSRQAAATSLAWHCQDQRRALCQLADLVAERWPAAVELNGVTAGSGADFQAFWAVVLSNLPCTPVLGQSTIRNRRVYIQVRCRSPCLRQMQRSLCKLHQLCSVDPRR